MPQTLTGKAVLAFEARLAANPEMHLLRCSPSDFPQSLAAASPRPVVEPIEVEIDHGRRVNRENCDTRRPPTIAMPSGRRNSEPAPWLSAIGRAPNSVAMVVIMMGRKRSRHAS